MVDGCNLRNRAECHVVRFKPISVSFSLRYTYRPPSATDFATRITNYFYVPDALVVPRFTFLKIEGQGPKSQHCADKLEIRFSGVQ